MTRGNSQASGLARRGAALVLVMVFMVGALALAAALLAATDHHARSEGELHRQRALHAVLRAGAASAVAEINRDAVAGPYDPDGDGVGALLGPLAGDARAGVELRAPDGRLLGRYRTTARTDPATGDTVLMVLAAYPGFDVPGALVVGAELVLTGGRLEVGDSPLEIIGPAAGSERRPERLTRRLKVERSSLLVADPTFSAPALNITDARFHELAAAALERELREGDAVIVGGPSSGQGEGQGGGPPAWAGGGPPPWAGQGGRDDELPPAASGMDTVASRPSTNRVTQDALAALSAGLHAYAEESAASASDLAAAALAQGATLEDGRLRAPASGIVELPDGTYRVSSDLWLDQGLTLRGSGTLVVDGKLTTETAATLSWDGIVVVGGADPRKAELRVKAGGTLEVTGVLATDASERKAKLAVEGQGTRVHVDGALLLLTDALDLGDDAGDDAGELKVKGGASLQVDGALVMVAEHLHFKVERGGQLAVNGALSLVIPDDARKGLHHFELKEGADVQVLADRAAMDRAMQALERFADAAFGGRGLTLPVRATGYFERPVVALRAEQDAAIEAGTTGVEDDR